MMRITVAMQENVSKKAVLLKLSYQLTTADVHHGYGVLTNWIRPTV